MSKGLVECSGKGYAMEGGITRPMGRARHRAGACGMDGFFVSGGTRENAARKQRSHASITSSTQFFNGSTL